MGIFLVIDKTLNRYSHAFAYAKARLETRATYAASTTENFTNFFNYRYGARFVNTALFCKHEFSKIKITDLSKLSNLNRSTIYLYIEYAKSYNILENNLETIEFTEGFLIFQEKYAEEIFSRFRNSVVDFF